MTENLKSEINLMLADLYGNFYGFRPGEMVAIAGGLGKQKKTECWENPSSDFPFKLEIGHEHDTLHVFKSIGYAEVKLGQERCINPQGALRSLWFKHEEDRTWFMLTYL